MTFPRRKRIHLVLRSVVLGTVITLQVSVLSSCDGSAHSCGYLFLFPSDERIGDTGGGDIDSVEETPGKSCRPDARSCSPLTRASCEDDPWEHIV